MITPDWLEKVAGSLEVHKRLQDTILKDIIRRLAKTDFAITDNIKWQAEKLQQAGVLYDNILSEVKKAFPDMEKEIAKAFDDAGIEVFNYSDDELEKAGYSPKEFKTLSPAMRDVLYAASAKVINDTKNLVRTTASMTQHTFISACELAHQQIVSGAFSYTQAIANAVNQAAPVSGYVHYPSGARATVETAVRRAVMTGVNQTAAKLQDMRGEELGCDLVEVTAHFGARPDHAEWQGGVYSRSGKHPDYDSFEVCGYGTVEGLCGANCNHNYHLFFEGISKRLYSDKELKDMKDATVKVDGVEIPVYKAISQQRTLERAVKDEKKRLVGLSELQKVSGDRRYSSDFDRRAGKLKEKERALDNWCKKTGLTYEGSRVQVYGFDRSLAQRAVYGSRRFEVRENYIKNIKPTLPKIAKIDNRILQHKVEYGTMEKGGIIPSKTEITNAVTMAGYGSSDKIKDIDRLVSSFGGEDYKWSKNAGTVESKYRRYEVHWYEYDGVQYERKWKGHKEI